MKLKVTLPPVLLGVALSTACSGHVPGNEADGGAGGPSSCAAFTPLSIQTCSSTPLGGDASLCSGLPGCVPLPASGAPSARFGALSAWTGSAVVVWGGQSSTGGITDYGVANPTCGGPVLNDGALFDPVAGDWRPMSTVGAPPPRLGAVGAAVDGKFVVFGGADHESEGSLYDPSTDSWTTVSSNPHPTAAPGVARDARPSARGASRRTAASQS